MTSGHEHAGHQYEGAAASLADSTSDGVRALRLGVVGLAVTTVVQTALLLLSGSVALLGDTLHNGVDVAGTAVVWAAFALSRRQRTDAFGYGFHRVEDLAGLVVVLLIAGSAALVGYESITAFGAERDLSRPWLVLAAGLFGFAGNEAVAQYKLRVGKRIRSSALVADGQHSRADGLTSLGVVAAAIGIMFDQPRVDAVIGLGIALFIGCAAFETGRKVILQLLDHGDPELRDRLERASETVLGLHHINELRVRNIGRTAHVVANICLPAESSLREAHEVSETVRLAFLRVLPPGSIVDIHADPFEAGVESHRSG